MTKALREAVAYPTTAAYAALTEELRAEYVRNDAAGFSYAWGRLDQGHPPVLSVDQGHAPSATDSAWVFGSLYAQMLLELHHPVHPRTFGFAMQSAWAEFAKTSCPDGSLPQQMSV